MTLEQVLEQNGTTLDSIHGHYFSSISPDELDMITKEIGSHDGTTIYEIASEHGKLWLAECRDGSAHVLCQDDLDQLELDTVTVDLKAVLDRVDEQENVTLYDVLEGRAHIIVSPGGECLRATVPSNFSDDPDAYDGIIISSYPEPMMPDSVEVARLSVTGEKALENWLNTNKEGWTVEVDN